MAAVIMEGSEVHTALTTTLTAQATGGTGLTWWQVVLLFVGAPVALFALITAIVALTTDRAHVPEGVKRLRREQRSPSTPANAEAAQTARADQGAERSHERAASDASDATNRASGSPDSPPGSSG